MPWSAIAAPLVSGAVSSIFGPDQAPASSGGGSGGAAAADPFASQRPQYQAKLSAMMNGGFTPDDPSYKWRFDQGMEAVNRGTAAKGGLLSGGRLLALEDYGSGLASTEYQRQFDRLAGLAGATSGSPGSAGQIIDGQYQRDQQGSLAFGNQVGKAVVGWGNKLLDKPAETYTPQQDISGWDGWNMA